MNTETELLPCPFCGGGARKTTDPIGYGEAFCIIACTQCDCCINVSDPDFNVAESKATDAWNTRVYPAAVQKLIKRDTAMNPMVVLSGTKSWLACGSCGATVVCGHNYCWHCGRRLDRSEE